MPFDIAIKIAFYRGLTTLFWVMLILAWYPLDSHARITSSALPQATINKVTDLEVEIPGGGVPVGTIVAWPVATNPDDWDKWLECNGQSITRTAYPEICAVADQTRTV